MPFGLTIATERAIALQQSIQDELTKRGYSPDADPVMAEYITIMIINNKTAAQITSELEDLIGSDFDHSFTDWLFAEAAKGASGSNSPSHIHPPPDQNDRDLPPHIHSDTPRRPSRAGLPLHQQAILQAQAAPSSSSSTHKRSASTRSLSPGHPNKARRTDLPTGPRAMLRDGNISGGGQSNSRSLIERVNGPVRSGGPNGFQRDDIQARIDNITNNSPDPNMMMPGTVFPNGMDMNAAMGMANPLVLQEMMMNQMAMMAQMASTMGMLNPNAGTGQFGGGFPMQGVVPGFQGGGVNGFSGPQHQQLGNGGGRGRGAGRGSRGTGSVRGRGGQPAPPQKASEDGPSPNTPMPTTIISPAPTTAVSPAPLSTTSALTTIAASQPRPGYVPPERPMSPTLCKFGLKCTNALCRYSHPSPVATAESGVVLSNEACDKGIECKDKDCIKAHVSPAVLTTPPSELPPPNNFIPPAPAPQPGTTVQCRFGSACTRPNCPFIHPTVPKHKGTHNPSPQNHFVQQCRFGAGCTRSTCPFQHPEGRVLPTAFHRGLSTTAPIVNVVTPEAGSMGPSPHRSVTFNNGGGTGGGAREKLERQVREIEEKKSEAERKVKEAQAEAGKKDGAAPVAIAV